MDPYGGKEKYSSNLLLVAGVNSSSDFGRRGSEDCGVGARSGGETGREGHEGLFQLNAVAMVERSNCTDFGSLSGRVGCAGEVFGGGLVIFRVRLRVVRVFTLMTGLAELFPGLYTLDL